MTEEQVKYVERQINIELLNDKLNYIIAMLESIFVGEQIEKKDGIEEKEPDRKDKSIY